VHIILTHEQADFDALASLLGAYLLNEAALPVLPRRLNRNVRAYITLYGLDLPFIDPRDLPKQNIETVTLVDTQSPVSIKGMSAKTQVQVIDHHPRRTDLPAEWTVTSEPIGAATTLLVEALQERNGHLTLVQATLLLLGIYEDTGSLRYTRTTPRDVRAAAFLLEQGASLQIATGFLNHPLSPEQQSLYDQLHQSTETHQINGQTIILASGDATAMDEELSTLAHKLRDVLDPDGLILLFATRAGTQLIGRATTDYVDVAAIAEHFGGGGHPRAAAALIHKPGMDEIKEELISLLPQHVRPVVTVAEIMSRGPQLFAPDTPVKTAAAQMARYGYEGYPVVADGKVAGLLTRRAVDRALNHKLNLTAADLMEAGEVTIEPDAAVEALQRRMTDTGWGQIPVVDPETNQIIGIVTRTDLLKILTPEPANGSAQNLAGRLEDVLPAGRLVFLKAVAQAAHSQHAAFYIVGGFVRDLLLERPSMDYDLVVEGDAIALAKSLVKEYGGRLTTHARFGTSKWQIEQVRPALAKKLSQQTGAAVEADQLPTTLDLVSARREFYKHPTALPTVERGSIKLDLHRRDFTINTLALRLDGRHYGELNDHWGGLTDLQNGRVRVLHSLSFVDDPTRILRAVRFEQRFGFTIEPRTLELLDAALPLLDRVSGDRLRHELDIILAEDNRRAMLDRLAERQIIAAIHPDLRWDGELGQQIDDLLKKVPDPIWGLAPIAEQFPLHTALTYTLWFMQLPKKAGQAVCRRLKLPGIIGKAVAAASDLVQDLPEIVKLPASQAAARLDGVAPLGLYAVFLCANEAGQNRLQTYITEWKQVQANITGDDLRERGIPPGPEYRRILARLRAAWLDGEIASNLEEDALLEKLLDESN